MLAREFGIAQTRVIQLLEATGGDPLRQVTGSDLGGTTDLDLHRERQRLRDRIASDRRRLHEVEDEIDVRATDRLLGLAD